MAAERLESKKIGGHTYYYYSAWGWKNGRCRRLWQKYLGKLSEIVKAVDGGGPAPAYAEVFDFGLVEALWRQLECCQVVEIVDRLCPKRDQGLSVGQYLAIASANRAAGPVSKRAMWDWVAGTTLLRRVQGVSQEAMKSQRFWDHMARLSPEDVRLAWRGIVQQIFRRGEVDLSDICYDGTNFYTFIGTFNIRSELARRGKNKQGRGNLRQISYALFCTRREGIPLFYDVYEGNMGDARQFPIMCEAFGTFVKEVTGRRPDENGLTLIFDKGNNSQANIEGLDALSFRFIGSVKLDEHRDLARISNGDARFVKCTSPDLAEIKAFEVEKVVYGKSRRVVVVHNQELFDDQRRTLENDIEKAVAALADLKQTLDKRAEEPPSRGGRAPTAASVRSQCERIASRQYLRQIVRFEVAERKRAPQLTYSTDADALARIADTYLGKKLIVSNDRTRTMEELIVAYHSQYVIEHAFKDMKDRHTGCWWPLNHWTDNQVRVHGLYCTIAMLIRTLMHRRLQKAGMKIPMRRMLDELADIREVVNVYPTKRKSGPRTQTVLSKTNQTQSRMMEVLEVRANQTLTTMPSL